MSLALQLRNERAKAEEAIDDIENRPQNQQQQQPQWWEQQAQQKQWREKKQRQQLELWQEQQQQQKQQITGAQKADTAPALTADKSHGATLGNKGDALEGEGRVLSNKGGAGADDDILTHYSSTTSIRSNRYELDCVASFFYRFGAPAATSGRRPQ